MKRFSTFLLALLLSTTAAAQDDLLEDEQENVRRYTVEIIIFRYVEEVSTGTEIFPADEPPEDLQALSDDELEVPADEDVEPEPRDLDIVMLTEDEYTMSNTLRQFELLDVYETTMHFGWTQSTYPKDETPPIELRVFGKPPAGLDGSLTLYLGRYLHLVVDLALDAPEDFSISAANQKPRRIFGDSRIRYGDNFGQVALPVRYRIQENRIIKNGDVRYFDHPKFGVVTRITRVEEEEIDADEILEPAPLSSRSGQ